MRKSSRFLLVPVVLQSDLCAAQKEADEPFYFEIQGPMSGGGVPVRRRGHGTEQRLNS
jgi:hypothetical protein